MPAVIAAAAQTADSAAVAGAEAGWPEWLLVGLVLGGFLPGLFIYARLLVRSLKGWGQVASEGFGPLEAGFAAALASLFLFAMVAIGFNGGKGPAAPEPNAHAIVVGVVADTVLKGIIVSGLFIALGWRGRKPAELFGFERHSFRRTLALGAGLLAAALPLVYAAMIVAGHWARPEQGQEEAVRLLTLSEGFAPRMAVILAAVVVAPMVEEFLFRGYLYGVLRRYLGPAAGIALNSALFAGIHLHVPSLGPLFALAVCLTLAYEATGSLLVPMTMHALFNAQSVAFLLLGFGGG